MKHGPMTGSPGSQNGQMTGGLAAIEAPPSLSSGMSPEHHSPSDATSPDPHQQQNGHHHQHSQQPQHQHHSQQHPQHPSSNMNTNPLVGPPNTSGHHHLGHNMLSQPPPPSQSVSPPTSWGDMNSLGGGQTNGNLSASHAYTHTPNSYMSMSHSAWYSQTPLAHQHQQHLLT